MPERAKGRLQLIKTLKKGVNITTSKLKTFKNTHYVSFSYPSIFLKQFHITSGNINYS